MNPEKGQKAVPPSLVTVNRLSMLVPRDPQGGGTWIGVNEKGLAVALLNDYQTDYEPEHKVSRGQLVLDCLSKHDFNSVKKDMQNRSFKPYPGFICHVLVMMEWGSMALEWSASH